MSEAGNVAVHAEVPVLVLQLEVVTQTSNHCRHIDSLIDMLAQP